MSLEGALQLQLTVRAGQVAEVGLSSTRRTDLSQLLVKRPLDEALKLLPSLFAVCGGAHAMAALEACESALGVEVEPSQLVARRLLALLETLDNQAFALCVEWPQLLGKAPRAAELQALRGATVALKRWAVEPRWVVVGGVPLKLQGLAPAKAVMESTQALLPSGGDLLEAVAQAKAERFGSASVPLMPELDASWFAQRLVQPEFSARPSLDGTCVEAGAVARAQHTRAVEVALKEHGRGLFTRVLSRLADLEETARQVEETVRQLRASPGGAKATRSDGDGAGVADCARGRLAHRVELNDGKVTAWRTVAPTEWSFHPQGAIRQALLGADAVDLERKAKWLVAAMDPCVPCTVSVL